MHGQKGMPGSRIHDSPYRCPPNLTRSGAQLPARVGFSLHRHVGPHEPTGSHCIDHRLYADPSYIGDQMPYP